MISEYREMKNIRRNNGKFAGGEKKGQLSLGYRPIDGRGKGKSYQLIPRLLYIFTRGWLRIKLINPQQSKA